jgi:F-type H+-transporting ATPase subunit delta
VGLNMPGTTAAKRYAKALLALATEQDVQEQVGSELSRVAQALADPAVAKVLALPTLPLKTRKEIVKQFVTALSPQLLIGNFLHVLAENDRLSALSDIENAYQRLLERALGRVRAQILSATPLSETELEQLVGAFSRLTNRTVVPTVEVNPDLLGGVMVEIEGRVYDASLRTQLRRLGDTLAQQI